MIQHSHVVSTDWLRRHQGAENLIILDASVFLDASENGERIFRSGLEAFQNEGHLPGARFADLFTEFSDPLSSLPFTRPSAAQFEEAAGRLGIDRDAHVIIYDNLIGQWSARLWWVFRTFGHPKVSVLNGGQKKFVREGGRLEVSLTPYRSTIYEAPEESRYLATQQDIVNILSGQRAGSLVCFLQPDDFSGAAKVRARPGHIPKSINLPFTNLIDPDTKLLLDPDKLRREFSKVANLDGELIVTYCGGGIASTLGALALASIGYANTLEYDGSLAEWSANPDLPMEIGRLER